MPPNPVWVKRWTYDVAWDDPPKVAGRVQRIASWQLLDAATNEPLQTTITLTIRQKKLHPHIAEDGLIGVVGIPLNVFPKLKTQSYPVNVTIEAAGYVARQVQSTVQRHRNLNFPDEFTPALHRPVTMQPV